MGSELLDESGKPLWSLRSGSVVRALRTLGGSLRRLALPAGIGDGAAPDGVKPGRMLGGLHVIPGIWSPVAGYAGLVRFLCSDRFHLVEEDPAHPEVLANLVRFPYDWRLSNRHNARLLKEKASTVLERWQSQPGMEEAKLVLLCHSMGGLVARWFLEREGGAAVTRALVTIGTPHRGSVKALGTLVNGLEPGVGRLRFGLTGLARSLPSLYELLPTYDCVVGNGGARAPVAESGVSELCSRMLSDAADFHTALAQPPPDDGYEMHKIVGIRQPTLTTAVVRGGGVGLFNEIDGLNQGGDGTVSRLAAEPEFARGIEVHEVADQHGELQVARSTLDLIDGILSRQELIWEGPVEETFGVEMDELWSPRDEPVLEVVDLEDRRLDVTVLDEAGEVVAAPVVVRPDGRATLPPLPPGGYRARVASPVPGGPSPVTVPFLVWDPAADIEDGPR
ncbi:MAG: esterase/lipase family protein [Solirubrobacteraceae bacterium]